MNQKQKEMLAELLAGDYRPPESGTGGEGRWCGHLDGRTAESLRRRALVERRTIKGTSMRQYRLTSAGVEAARDGAA